MHQKLKHLLKLTIITEITQFKKWGHPSALSNKKYDIKLIRSTTFMGKEVR